MIQLRHSDVEGAISVLVSKSPGVRPRELLLDGRFMGCLMSSLIPTMTAPALYSPFGIMPSKSAYASGSSSAQGDASKRFGGRVLDLYSLLQPREAADFAFERDDFAIHDEGRGPLLAKRLDELGIF
jgi:hypothetical protein